MACVIPTNNYLGDTCSIQYTPFHCPFEMQSSRLSLPKGPSSTSGTSRSPSPLSRTEDESPGLKKPKATKSRNGCITCKAKRLKCDETKPTCLQCKKRNIDCGGYKKSFKWKSFDETSFGEGGSGRAKEMSQTDYQRQSSPSSYHEAVSDPSSPTNRPHSQSYPLAGQRQLPQSATLSIPTPQTYRRHSQPLQGSTYQQPTSVDHLQVLDYSSFVSSMPHSELSTPTAYSPFSNPSPSELEAGFLDAMLAQELHSPLDPNNLYTGSASPVHMEYDSSLIPMPPDLAPNVPQCLPMDQGALYSFAEQDLLIGGAGQPHSVSLQQWYDEEEPRLQDFGAMSMAPEASGLTLMSSQQQVGQRMPECPDSRPRSAQDPRRQ